VVQIFRDAASLRARFQQIREKRRTTKLTKFGSDEINRKVELTAPPTHQAALDVYNKKIVPPSPPLNEIMQSTTQPRQMSESRSRRRSRANDCEASKHDVYGCLLSQNGNTSASHVHDDNNAA